MHDEALAFVASVAGQVKDGARILEIGALDVNGSPRALFAHAGEYLGLDVRKGPGVQVKADGATWPGDGRPFDVVVCTETLEHTTDPAAILANARTLLKPGGLLILTCASADRPPHDADGHGYRADSGEPYTAIRRIDLTRWLSDWDAVEIEHHKSRGDLYATATAPKGKR